ncbi:unnamed protein product [Parnassius mnemosyne]|uniref:Retrovirus-related Pol polyprotein from type-1 retrotransposable element R1 n=1 Tax=Parnassius mnemosyne TaxID=213953 RepID=A0AAV1L3E7_9NEOP
MQEPYVGAKAHLTVGSQYRVIQKISHDLTKPVRSAIVVTDPNIQFIMNPSMLTEDIVGVELRIGNYKIGFVSIYLHEKGNIEEDLSTLKRIVEAMNTEDIVIGGDANASSIWWGCKADDKRGAMIMETVAELNLEILNTGKYPTFSVYRMGTLCSSIIDITTCTTSVLHKITNWRVDDSFCTISSHKPILYNLSTPSTSEELEINSTRKYNTRKANWNNFSNELEKALHSNNITQERIAKIKTKQEIDEIVNEYTESIVTACNKVIPKIERKRVNRAAKWWNEELQDKKKEMIRLRRRIKNAHQNRRNYVIEQYLQARDIYKKSIEDASTKSWKDLCTKEQKESIWQCTYRILKICSNREEDKLLRNQNGDILTEKESATLLAETFFLKDNTSTDTEEQKDIRTETKEFIMQLNSQTTEIKRSFTRVEIQQIFKNMEPKKAPGDDGLTSDICQEAYSNNPEVLRTIYNKCLELGYFPNNWKKATIKVIPKPHKEDYTQPKAYRPIGLLPVFGKVLEKLFTNRVQWQLGKENKLSRRQYGFTPQKSTEDALYDTITLIRNGLHKKEIVILVSLDIEGAFDNAWWPAIISELRKKQMDTAMLKLITSYLSNRKISLKYAGQNVSLPTDKGCIQGSTCGPMLWNILLDSLLQATENLAVHVQAFADDILIVASNKDGQQIEKDINDALKLIVKWGQKHKLKFAPHKTQATIITKKLKYHCPRLLMDQVTLTYTDQLKVLGLIIDKNLNFKPHLDHICNKAVSLYKTVSRAARAKWGLNSDIVRTIYLAVVEPTVLYAASCWAEATEKKYVQRILNRLTRMFSIRICKGHKTISLVSGALLAKIIPLALRVKENAEIYEIKRGKPIESLPGRHLETKISPYNLPHPSLRQQRQYKFITNQEDIDKICNNWPSIYTDGSKIDNRVGAAISVWQNEIEIKNITCTLERYCSVYQAELVAIHKAVKYMLDKKCYKANILSDSRSAIMTICNPSSLHPIAAEISSNLSAIESHDGKIEFYWIKAHCGLKGNERADELAKYAATKKKQRAIYDLFPLSYAKHLTRNNTLLKWQHKYEEAATSETTKTFFPNIRVAYKILKNIKITNIITQLFTGHGGNKAYLFRFKLSSSPYCTCDDNSPQTVEHIIIDCPRFCTKRYECECSMGMTISKQNLCTIMEDNDCRSNFLNFALLVLKTMNKENGSTIID